MYLHNNKQLFSTIITKVNNNTSIDTAIIEKDYYVFMALKLIVSKRKDEAVFKGGTSLSKAYGVIQRFSEDIDLCLPSDKIKNDGARRRLTNAITSSIEELGLIQYSERRIERSGTYNDIRGQYNSLAINSFVEPYIKVETAHRIREYPIERRLISNYIGDFLRTCTSTTEIEQYNLEPFYVNTVSIYRTFIDKLFAIADYYLAGKDYKYSRHLYDLYKIICVTNWRDETIVNDLRQLLSQVRMERQTSKSCLSAQPNMSLKLVLNNTLTSDFFKNDYNNITRNVLFDSVSYDMCKSTLLSFINSSIIV